MACRMCARLYFGALLPACQRLDAHRGDAHAAYRRQVPKRQSTYFNAAPTATAKNLPPEPMVAPGRVSPYLPPNIFLVRVRKVEQRS